MSERFIIEKYYTNDSSYQKERVLDTKNNGKYSTEKEELVKVLNTLSQEIETLEDKNKKIKEELENNEKILKGKEELIKGHEEVIKNKDKIIASIKEALKME